MRKLNKALVLALVLAVTAFGIASAAPRVPTSDTYTNINAADTSYGTEVQLWQTLSGNAGICTTTRITYVNFALTGLTGTIGSATLQFTRVGGTSNPQSYTIGLYEVANGWTETSTWNTAPQPTTLLETQPYPVANGDKVTFVSQALIDSLKAKAGGNASYALMLVAPGGAGTCSSTVTAVMGSRESGANAPVLTLLGATAVEMSSASAQQTNSWPLYAGLAAVALIVIAGVTISRRRIA